MVAVEIVEMLDLLFSRFDNLAARFGLEKIKTIGDGYMVAGGVPDPRPDHAAAVIEMAMGMSDATKIATRALGVLRQPLRVRIGIHSGPLIAGVLGTNKLIYDVWGDTVNIASRMEKYGEPGRIHVSAATCALLGDRYSFEPRGMVEIKGKGKMETYFLERRIGPHVAVPCASRLVIPAPASCEDRAPIIDPVMAAIDG
jgi:class 3 adenylate cyclase